MISLSDECMSKISYAHVVVHKDQLLCTSKGTLKIGFSHEASDNKGSIDTDAHFKLQLPSPAYSPSLNHFEMIVEM